MPISTDYTATFYSENQANPWLRVEGGPAPGVVGGEGAVGEGGHELLPLPVPGHRGQPLRRLVVLLLLLTCGVREVG